MKRRVKDISGLRVGKLVAVSVDGFDENGRSLWLCKCDCGCEIVRAGYAMTRAAKKKQKSHCGCSPALKTHGLTSKNKHLYQVWGSMVQRCGNPSNKDYPNYGGRGITMCSQWRNSYPSFQEWALAAGYRRGLTIERNNVNDGYNPENCCWTPNQRQALNTRRSVMITFDGKTQHISDWAREVGISSKTIKTRIAALGWSIERALTEKPTKGKNQYA